ncbi:MAG: uncharacterized protein A8A55_2817 [Amphiamblys sp. WSBS2006]|nr:MAG: uncharacterized protein A8A55_2817 [Amphiamblys sp. WSBS2006]
MKNVNSGRERSLHVARRGFWNTKKPICGRARNPSSNALLESPGCVRYSSLSIACVFEDPRPVFPRRVFSLDLPTRVHRGERDNVLVVKALEQGPNVLDLRFS